MRLYLSHGITRHTHPSTQDIWHAAFRRGHVCARSPQALLLLARRLLGSLPRAPLLETRQPVEQQAPAGRRGEELV